jgi:hypothetical protein
VTHNRRWTAALLALLPAITASLTAQDTTTVRRDSFNLEYAVKFVCGTPRTRAVAPGLYFTAINVHNPYLDTALFRKKVASTLPGEQPGPISPFWFSRLASDQALEIDCDDIFRHARLEGFGKGFVVIQSRTPLDVVAVYTAAGNTRQVVTMELERVNARRLIGAGCPDLVVDSILRPVWDAANNRSVITAIIRNVGTAAAPASLARVIDPSTLQPTGAPYNAIATTPPLAPGAAVSVVFYLPYWVFNPDATLEVTADYKDYFVECHDDNNTKTFSGVG